ncbi:MAG: sensor histidine kinase [Thermoleophilaceae bacterium]|jgi:two-component system, OmpR family, sensor kinase
MASLRARLLACLLALAAVGLLIAGSVTYAEQRSFLFERVDQQAKSALRPLSHELDAQGYRAAPRPGGAPSGGEHDPSDRGDFGGPGPIDTNLPPGTYGQRRSASGKVLGSTTFSYGQTESSAPKIPAKLPLGEPITVSSGDDSVRYRVIAGRDPDDSGITVAAVPLRDVDQTLNRLLTIEAIVIGSVLLALAAAALFVVRLGLRPLDRMATTAGEIAAGRLSQRVSPATSRTEVGRLGLALNGMLARLERAFAERQASEDRLRSFLADASHELRTPLASIRGYAEVFHMGASADPAAVETSMKRIEEEARRMGLLVEDLLVLARLDELRDPIREPVDMRELAADAVEDARVTAADRPITLDGPDAAVVSGDPHQLRQVLGNLLRNALVHTPRGSAIEVRVGLAGEDVRVEVRDHGPGLPPGDPELLFERFWRAEAGRARGKAGAGLGLAIVAEIVDTHGGSVEAGDADGGGARFVVRLPRALSQSPV